MGGGGAVIKDVVITRPGGLLRRLTGRLHARVGLAVLLWRSGSSSVSSETESNAASRSLNAADSSLLITCEMGAPGCRVSKRERREGRWGKESEGKRASESSNSLDDAPWIHQVDG